MSSSKDDPPAESSEVERLADHVSRVSGAARFDFADDPPAKRPDMEAIRTQLATFSSIPEDLGAALVRWVEVLEADSKESALVHLKYDEELRAKILVAERRAEKAEAELEHRQKLWSQLSLAITRRSTEALRKKYGGNTPEWINGETDALTVIFRELEERVEQVGVLQQILDEAVVSLGALGVLWQEVPSEVRKLRSHADRVEARAVELEEERKRLREAFHPSKGAPRYEAVVRLLGKMFPLPSSKSEDE